MNYSHIIQPNFCEDSHRNFDPIKMSFIFSPLYAKTNRPILVPIEYLLCVEGGATNFTRGHTFNLLFRVWMVDKLNNRGPSQEETQILNHLLALQPHCNADFYPRALAACLARNQEFLEFFRDPDNRATVLQHHLGPLSHNTQRLTVLVVTIKFFLFFLSYLTFSLFLIYLNYP